MSHGDPVLPHSSAPPGRFPLPDGEERRKKRRLWLLVLGSLLAAWALIGLGVVAGLNHQNAAEWRARAHSRETEISSLAATLNARTSELADRTVALNNMAAKLRTTE